LQWAQRKAQAKPVRLTGNVRVGRSKRMLFGW
jgi:hypothetical protein